MPQYRDLLPLLISHALSSFMEKRSEEAQGLLVPPRRRKYNLVEEVGRVYLPHASMKMLRKLAHMYGIREVEVAELILQAILNSVPIVEMTGGDELNPEAVIDVISDSLILEPAIHKTHENLKTRKLRKQKVSDIEGFIHDR